MHRAANSVRVDVTREAGQGPRVRIQGQPAVFSASGVHLKAGIPRRDFGDRVGVLMETGKTASSASESRRCCGFGGSKGSSTIRAEASFRVGPTARWDGCRKNANVGRASCEKMPRLIGLAGRGERVVPKGLHDRSRPTSLMGRHRPSEVDVVWWITALMQPLARDVGKYRRRVA